MTCVCGWAQSTTPGPALAQSTLLSSPAQSMAVDPAGNRYVTSLGRGISKIAPDGTTLLWSGKGGDGPVGLDASGNVYSLGSCVVASCPPATNTYGNNLVPDSTGQVRALLLWKLDPA